MVYNQKKNRQIGWNVTMIIMIMINLVLASSFQDIGIIFLVFFALTSEWFLIWTFGNLYFVLWFRNYENKQNKQKEE